MVLRNTTRHSRQIGHTKNKKYYIKVLRAALAGQSEVLCTLSTICVRLVDHFKNRAVERVTMELHIPLENHGAPCERVETFPMAPMRTPAAVPKSTSSVNAVSMSFMRYTSFLCCYLSLICAGAFQSTSQILPRRGGSCSSPAKQQSTPSEVQRQIATRSSPAGLRPAATPPSRDPAAAARVSTASLPEMDEDEGSAPVGALVARLLVVGASIWHDGHMLDPAVCNDNNSGLARARGG